MEVKPGYKQTELGIIPEEWDVAPLSREIERLEAGVSVNSVDEELRGYAHEQAVLKTSAVAGGQFLPHENKRIAPRDIRRAKLNPRFDTIIISRMNTPDLVGECGYVFGDFPELFLPDRLWMTRNRNGSDVCVRWLNYLLSSKPYKTRIKGLATGTSGSMKNIAKDALLAMPIPYPDGDEQRAIAEALSDVDELLGELDRLIIKTRHLKQAAIEQLLTGKQRLPGFSGEWEVKRLGECLSSTPEYGINAPAVVFSHKLPTYIRITDITKDGRFAPETPVSVKGANAGSYYLSEGDLVFARTGASVGKSYLYNPEDGNLVFAGYLIRVRPNPVKLVASYLAAYVTTGCYWNWVHAMSMRSGQPGINSNEYAQLEIPLSTVAEQTAIASVLSDIDAEIEALEVRREKTHALKRGMMQELLTGRTRLV
jgi:type I restriction enzyme S subunit